MASGWKEEVQDTPLVLVDIDDGVGIVTLNRPDRLNAWTPSMGTQYFDALEALARDPAVRVIMVTGAGRAFCAGGDVSGLESVAQAGSLGELEDKRPYTFPLTIGKPIVATIRGACVGVGFQQALSCDVRICAEDAKFAVVFSRLGLIAETGLSWLMPRIVGAGMAMDLMLSGRSIDAGEAQRIGLVSRIVPADKLAEEALAYCRILADKCSPVALRTIKQQVHRDLTSDLPGAYARSQMLIEAAMEGPDFAEGVAAFREKRPPAFRPLPAELAKLDVDAS